MVELLIGSALGAVVAFLSLRLSTILRLRRYRRYDISSTDNQLRFVGQADLRAAIPINREAFSVFKAIETDLQRRRSRYRLLAEVAMGAFIRTANDHGTALQRKRAYSAYGSKRVDFLIIDPYGRPALAVEYHGTGHTQGNAAARDAVKKHVLQKAGVELLEIYDYSTPRDYLQALSHILERHEARHQRTH